MSRESEAEDYFWKDFAWEDLQQEIEQEPIYRYHLIPLGLHPSSPNPISDSQAWKRFHLRHCAGKFFKERRYLLKEFPELVSCGENSKVLEVGCGNGSTALPILRGNKHVIVYACDCTSEILERAKEIISSSNIVSHNQRFHAFYCDLSNCGFPKWLACNHCQELILQNLCSHMPDVEQDNVENLYPMKKFDCCIGGVDFVTLIFTLSAVPFEKMPTFIEQCFRVLKPGGLLLFRDYGLYDMTMLRFGPDKRVGFREYMRADQTRSYFFSLEITRDLFLGAGFIEVELVYCCVKSVNRRNGKSLQRVWVHGKFQKLLCS